jgi:hypothetical protein
VTFQQQLLQQQQVAADGEPDKQKNQKCPVQNHQKLKKFLQFKHQFKQGLA